jgi:hypothetical protein
MFSISGTITLTRATWSEKLGNEKFTLLNLRYAILNNRGVQPGLKVDEELVTF